jgi:hypothetical protein
MGVLYKMQKKKVRKNVLKMRKKSDKVVFEYVAVILRVRRLIENWRMECKEYFGGNFIIIGYVLSKIWVFI